jgi:peptidyl-Lys metalloendopeptidase
MSKLLRFGRVAAVVGLSLVFQACAGPEDLDGLDGVDSDSMEARAADLDVKLSLDQVAYAAHEPVLATVTITNRGKNPAKLLSWLLPADDLEEPLFRVTRPGAVAEFVGPHYKRPAAADTDFIHLAAGASLTRTVDLARFYDLSATGDYKVVVEVAQKTSNTVSAWVEGRAVAAPEPLDIDAGTASLAYSGRCSLTQQDTIAGAVGQASSYSQAAMDYLGRLTSTSTRFTTWFGPYSSARRTTAYNHFVAIDDAFDTKPITVDCKCKKNYYAYVYPTQPYVIYVCRAFWNAPLAGTDSKAGTLIHEMSHFNVVASTDDWAYGQSACKNLAISDPSRALDNADSHEYFAENTPALP